MLCIMRGDLDTEVVPGSGVNTVIKEGKAWNQEKPIGILNPIITGRANYHRSIVSKEIFGNDREWNCSQYGLREDIQIRNTGGLPNNTGMGGFPCSRVSRSHRCHRGHGSYHLTR